MDRLTEKELNMLIALNKTYMNPYERVIYLAAKEVEHYRKLEEQGLLTRQKHGYWKDINVENSTGRIFICSNCKGNYNANNQDIKLGRAEERPDYCPNCGAKMDLKEENQ